MSYKSASFSAFTKQNKNVMLNKPIQKFSMGVRRQYFSNQLPISTAKFPLKSTLYYG